MRPLVASSIGRKIVGALTAIYLLTYGLTALVVYTGVRRSLLDSAADNLAQVADLKYQRLDNRVAELATDLTAWAQLEVMNDLVSGDVDRRVATTLEGLRRLYGLTGGIYAFDAGGSLIAAATGGTGGAGAPGSGGRAGMAARGTPLPTVWRVAGHTPTFFDKHRDPLGGGSVVALAIPVYGTFAPDYRDGTLVITVPWDAIETLLGGLETSTALVRLPPRPQVLSPPPGSGTAGGGGDGTDGAIIGRSLPRGGLLRTWQVVVSQPVSAVTRPLRHVALELALLGLLLGVPIYVSVRWMARRLTAPITALTRAARAIADTDQTDSDRLDIHVPVTSRDELGFLAGAFNRMTDSLRHAMRERDRSLRALEHLNQTLEGKVAARTAELEAAIAAQRRLIRDISHEIKSPLARLGMALGLARRQLADAAPRHLDRMEREVAAIAALASELLTLARLEGAATGLDPAPVDLPALVRDIIDDALYEHPDRRGDLAFEQAADLPGGGVLLGNTDLLRRAIENIIRNALFYTAAGVPVVVDLVASGGEPGQAEGSGAGGGGGLRLSVRDQGPGVPDDAIGQLFEPFYRADPARGRDTGGTGIGLTICKRVVELHGGQVRAAHNHPHGLTVEITLPGR